MPQAQTVYTTKDGRRYLDAEMAERHERLTEARDKYAAAQREYTSALLETQVTADGKPFRFGALTDYYYVHPNHNGGLPFLKMVTFSVWDTKLDDADELNVVTKGDGGNSVTYCISDLYASRREAEIALLHKQMERVTDFTADVLKLRQRLGLMGVEFPDDVAAANEG